MRLSTIFSIAVIGLSGAALAQVTQAPVEQKLGNDAPTAVQNLSTPPAGDDVAPANTMASPLGNATDSAPPAGEPTASSSSPPSA